MAYREVVNAPRAPQATKSYDGQVSKLKLNDLRILCTALLNSLSTANGGI